MLQITAVIRLIKIDRNRIDLMILRPLSVLIARLGLMRLLFFGRFIQLMISKEKAVVIILRFILVPSRFVALVVVVLSSCLLQKKFRRFWDK
jgi:hypothetical protein